MAMTLAVVGDGDDRAATFVAASTVAEMTLVMPVLAVEVALVAQARTPCDFSDTATHHNFSGSANLVTWNCPTRLEQPRSGDKGDKGGKASDPALCCFRLSASHLWFSGSPVMRASSSFRKSGDMHRPTNSTSRAFWPPCSVCRSREGFTIHAGKEAAAQPERKGKGRRQCLVDSQLDRIR